MATERTAIDFVTASPITNDTYLLGLNISGDSKTPAKSKLSDVISILESDTTVKKSEVGKPLGVASLDGNGKVPESQLPVGSHYDFSRAIGDGRRVYTITHNLDTEFPQVRVIGAGNATFTFTNIDRNNIQIEFSDYISNDSVTVYINAIDYLGLDFMSKPTMDEILEN